MNGNPYEIPSLADVRAARDGQDAATQALRAAISQEQDLLLENLMDAVEDRYRSGWHHLVSQLAEVFPGIGPGIRQIADTIEWRIDA